MALLHADRLNVALGATPILHDLRFDVAGGTWVGLIGPNGSGKTTLLRTIGGLLPYDGSLTLDGRPVRQWKAQALARRLAFVRQSTSLSVDFTVEDLVLLGRAPHKRWLEGYRTEDRALMAAALEEVELEGFEQRSVLSLSGGELQRVFLAQALVQEADLLLLDEPTAHLDVHYQYEFMNRVAALVESGRTVIAVFHDLELAARYAHHLLVLDGGRIASSGPPEDVLTETLIARVFRMDAHCEAGDDGLLRILYRAPTP